MNFLSAEIDYLKTLKQKARINPGKKKQKARINPAPTISIVPDGTHIQQASAVRHKAHPNRDFNPEDKGEDKPWKQKQKGQDKSCPKNINRA